jgi:hypothetical protein
MSSVIYIIFLNYSLFLLVSLQKKGLELLQSFFTKAKYFIIGYLLLDFDIFIQHYQVQLPQLILKHLQNLQN